MSPRKKHKYNHGTIEDCVCFEFDSGFNIDQICNSLHMTEKTVTDILIKHRRLNNSTQI
jgi:hypothetical protein